MGHKAGLAAVGEALPSEEVMAVRPTEMADRLKTRSSQQTNLLNQECSPTF